MLKILITLALIVYVMLANMIYWTEPMSGWKFYVSLPGAMWTFWIIGEQVSALIIKITKIQ